MSAKITSPSKNAEKFTRYVHSPVRLAYYEKSTDDILKYYFYFAQTVGFDISCKWSSKETIYMQCQSLFSGK